MLSSTNPWVKYVLLGLFAVLLVFVALSLAQLYTSYRLSVSMQRITSTVEAVAAKVESMPITARPFGDEEETLEAQVDAMTTAVASAEMAAGTAVAAAQTAVASLTSTPSPPPPGSMIPLEVGIDITYQADNGPGMLLFPIDNLRVYQSDADFEVAWPLDGPATVRLALIETEVGSGEWRLFHAEQTIDSEVISPTGWSEYAVLVERAKTEEGETAGEPSSVFEELVFAEGPEQEIVASTSFTVEPGSTTSDSLDTLEEDARADLDLSSKLLLADNSTGVMRYTLVIFDPAAGAGGNRCKARCRNCQGVYCFICRFCR
jgi:hypothetical protein